MDWPCAAALSVFVPVRFSDLWFRLSRFFFRLESEFLSACDQFLFYLLLEVASVAARDDDLVDLELRMNHVALSSRSAFIGSLVANQMQNRQLRPPAMSPFNRS